MPVVLPGDDIEGRALMRVLAVAQDAGAFPAAGQPAGEAARLPVDLVVRSDDVAEPGRDADVVDRGVPERLDRQPLPRRQVEAAVTHRREHVGVARGIGDHGDGAVVLGARPHHGRSADVDLFDDLGMRRTARHRLGERVQVGDQQLERGDTQTADRLDVRRVVLVGEQPGVHVGVQRLHAATEDLRETRSPHRPESRARRRRGCARPSIRWRRSRRRPRAGRARDRPDRSCRTR